jgi:hypothetical protein
VGNRLDLKEVPQQKDVAVVGVVALLDQAAEMLQPIIEVGQS